MVLGISNQSIPDLQSFIQDQGITFPVLHDVSGVYGDYNLPGGQSPYPRDFIVDQQGTLQYANTEYDPGTMTMIIESLLAPSPPEQRTVLAELFGATWCYFCSWASAAIDSLAQEFGPDSLVVLEYHFEDELAIPEGEARAQWYVPEGFEVPNMWFDGVVNVVGATSQVYEIYRSHITERISVPSPLHIELEIAADQASAKIRVVDTFSEAGLKAYFVLYENDVGGHHYVVRDILPTEDLIIHSVGDSVEVIRSLEFDSLWQPEQMGVAVFVQSESTKLVLQAAQELLAPHLFAPGDANGDGQIDVADVMYLINYLFIGGTSPDPVAAGDINCDDAVDVADVMYLINYLFIGGSPPGC